MTELYRSAFPPSTQGLRRRLDRGPVRHGNPRRRLISTWLVALLAAGALIARLAALQLSPSDRLVQAGEEQRLKTIELDAARGAIVDRNGADLAISVPQTTFFADSRAVTDAIGDAAKLAAILGEDPRKVQEKLVSGRSFVYIARQVDDEKAAAINALDLKYLGSYREDKRVRPSGDALGSSVIGRTDPDGNGITGLERDYDDVLSGQSGRLVVEQGAGGRTIPGGEEQLDPATAGSNLVLALDQGLQFEVEQMLMRAVDAAEAKGGTVIVSRPKTGEILVDANVVRSPIEAPVDPAAAATTTTTAAPASGADDADDNGDGAIDAPVVYGPAAPTTENRAVTWTYEPGSINKVVTMAGVLEEQLATPEITRSIPSSLEFYGSRFGQETRSNDEDLSLRQILAKSDNPGTISWAVDLGPERLYSYLTRFGLGTTTGLGFTGESPGKVRPVGEWSGSTLPTAAIGQGIAVTPMQMLDIYNTIANGGMTSPPRLVLGTETPDGEFVAAKPAVEPHRVVSEATAAALRDMLTTVVTEGTGTRAQVDGFSVAGKTGTAWKPINGSYEDADGRHALVTSFVGFLPANDPQLSIFVVLDEPKNRYATGGSVAAPLFREVASYAVRHLRIPPDVDPAPVDPETERVRADPQPASTPPSTSALTPTTTVAPTTPKRG